MIPHTRSMLFLAAALFCLGCGGDASSTPETPAGSTTTSAETQEVIKPIETADAPAIEEEAAPLEDVEKPAPEKTEKPAAAFYTVSTYDPETDPEADLAATVERASVEGKRILLQVGGKWCGWCRLLDEYVQSNEAVADVLDQHFLIMKVNYSEENRNEEFLGKYPDVPAYPHIFVLERSGEFLHSQGTAELEEGKSYNEERVLEFLNKWKLED